MAALPKISPELIKKYQEEIANINSSATAKRKNVALNNFFSWAVANGIVDANPLEKNVAPSTNEEVKTEPVKYGFSFANFTRIGILTCLVILIFLFTTKVKSPIDFKKIFGIEGSPESTIQVDQKITNNVTNTPVENKEISAFPAGNGSWNLFAKVPLKQVGSQTMTFKLYKSETDQTPVWTSEAVEVKTDSDGNALISLDNVPQEQFFDNNELYLGFDGANQRIPVSTANTPVVDLGDISLNAGISDTIKAVDGSDGDVFINPDGSGVANVIFEGTGQNFFNTQAVNLTSGSLYYGLVANNANGDNYDLLRLASGSNPTTKFSVNGEGDVYSAGNLNISGDGTIEGQLSAFDIINNGSYSQNGGSFSINQNEGDSASIVKNGTALSDVLTLTLDERGKPATANSIYSTLTLNRFDGAAEAAALHVDNGNAIFDGQIQLGRYATNPNTIGEGSIVYNTTDDQIYFNDGSAWQSLGSASTTPFTNLTSGTNTVAAMVVGSGASLTTSGTGTITATDLVCTGCVANSELANSAITFAGDTGSSAISLGGTQTIAGSGSIISTSQSGSTLTISITNDSLDFAQFKDAMTLDAATDIALGANTLSTSGLGALNFASTGQVTFAGNIDANSGVDVTGNLTLGASSNLIFGGTTTLAETTAANDSGAYNVGVFDEFDNSNSANVQDVLDDLDAAITTGSSWTLTGDSGSETINNTNTVSAIGGTNGIDTVVTATDTITLNLDTTEIGTTTFGSGSGIVWTFDAGATDPTLTFASDAITLTAANTTLSGDLAINGGNITTAFTADSTVTVTGTLTANGTVVLGDNGDTVAINSSDWDIDATGNASGIGTLGLDGDITNTQATPSIYLVDSTAASDDYSVNVDGSTFSIVNDTDVRTDLSIDGTGAATFGGIVNLASSGSLIFTDTNTTLAESTSAVDSGAYKIGVFDEFDNSSSSNVQAVLNDLDAAITSAAAISWTLAGDSGTPETVSSGNTATITGGTNGIDTVVSATDTLTINFDSTEVGTTTFGSGSGITWTFDAGATDPTLTFASDAITLTAATTSLSGDLDLADDNWVGLSSSAGLIEFDDQATDEVNILNANVGIGLSSPFSKLHIGLSDTDSATAPTGLTNANLYLQLGKREYGANSNRGIGFGYSGSSSASYSPAILGYNETDSTGNTNGALFFATRNVTTATQPTERMRITSAGDIGIGTTGPDAKLDVLAATGEQLRLTYSDGVTYSGFTTDSSGNLTIDNTGTKTIIADDLQISGDDLIMGTNTSGYLLIADGTNFNPTAVSGDITIDSTGATSIGNDKITEAKLKAVDAAVDEECLTYETTTGDFEWQSCASASMTSFTAAGDTGVNQTITDGDTLSIAGGTNGIDTVGTATDIVTLNLDTTEIGTTTFGSGSGITWTFDASAGTDTTIAFGNNTITATTGTLTTTGNLVVQGTTGITFNTGVGGDITFANGEKIDNDTDGTLTITSPNTTVSGDLTISGDDLIMGTNTSGYLLIADGTNFNPTAMSGDITIDGTGATSIGNDKVVEADLKAVDAAVDEECLTYETTTGDFEWQACALGAGTMSSFTVAGDSGGGQTISDSNTLSILGGTNGIDTVDSVTDTVTINLDATEIGTTTFGSGSGITWTFDASAGTDTTIAFGNDTVTFTSASTVFSGDTTISGGNINTGNIALTVGDATTDSITLLTDGTGNGEIVMPNDSVSPDEVLSAGQTDEYCLTYESTGDTWEWQTCGAAGSSVWSDLTAPSADLTLSMAAYSTTFNWDPGADSAETNFSLTTQGEDTVGADEDQVLLALSQTSNGTDVTQAADSLLTLTNNDANDPVVNAIRFDAGAAGTDFTYGINFDAATIGTAELVLQNGETIDNTSDGTIILTATTTQISGLIDANGAGTHDIAGTLNLSGNTLTTTGDLTINAGGNNVLFADSDTLNVGGKTATAYNFFADNTDSPEEAGIASDDDLYVGGDFEVDGIIYGDGTGLTSVDATTLDSVDSLQFLRSDTSDNFTSGTLTTDAGTTFDVNGDITISDTGVVFDGATTTFTTTGDLTLTVGGGDLIFSDAVTINIGGFGSDVAYNVISDSGGTPTSANINSDDDLFIEGALEIDGGIYSSLTAGSVVFVGTDGLLTQDNANFYFDDTNNRLGIGTTSPDRNLQSETNTAATNTVTYQERLTSMTTGTAANGIGAGLEFETEDAAGNAQLAAAIEGVLTDVTSTNEKGAIVIKTADQGSSTLNEAVRFTNQGDMVTNGHTDIASTTGAADIFVYDTTKDLDSGAWRNDDRAKASSWYNETLDDTSAPCDISTNDRCGRREFPEKAFIVASATNVYIFDAKDNYMWARFDQGTDYALDVDLNNNPSSVFAQNGKIFIGTNGSAATGVYIVDFKLDKITRVNTTDARDFAGRIGTRNTDPGTAYPDQTRTGMALVNATINDVSAITMQYTFGSTTSGNGESYLAVATDAGVSLVKLTDQVTYDFADNAGDDYNQVVISARGDIWTTNETTGTLERWANAFQQTADQTTPDNTFDESTTPAITNAAPTIQVAPSALYITENTSTTDATSPTIYLGTDKGLSVLNFKNGDGANSSTKYYTKDYISEELVGDIRGMWPLNNANSNSDFEDISVKANNMTGTNITANGDSVSGVRGTATDFDGSTEYLSQADDADLDFAASDNFAFGAWFKTSTAALQTIVSKKSSRSSAAAGYALGTLANGRVECMVSDGTTQVALNSNTGVYTDGIWHQATCVKTGTTSVSLYIDGVLVETASTATVTNTLDNGSATMIGNANALGLYYTGSIDEVFVTGESLTAGQIKKIYNVGLAALQNHTANRVTGITGADSYQRLNGNAAGGTSTTDRVFGIAIDSSNQFAYVGLNSAGDATGGLSVIGLDSDSVVDLYDNTANTTKDSDAGTQFDASDITSVSISGTPCAIGYNSGSTNCSSQFTLGIAGEASGGTTTSWLETSDLSLYGALTVLSSPTLNRDTVVVNNIFQVFNTTNNLADTTTGESIQTASFSVDAQGNVVYNYQGSVDGTGWDVNDSRITTGKLFDIDANALTSGTAFDLASSATAFTGNLASITLSGDNASNTGSLLALTNSGTTNTNNSLYIKHYADGTGSLAFRVDDVDSDTTPFVIDASGNVGIGTTSPVSLLNIANTSSSSTPRGAVFDQYTNSTAASLLMLRKSRGTTVGSYTVVNNGDNLGNITFSGADGSAFIQGAIVLAEVDGTPGTNDMPARLSFHTTADGASSATERVRIDSAGFVGIADTSPSVQLNIGTANTTHSLGASDLLVSDAFEVDGALYLDGKNIYNPQGTSAFILCSAGGVACATTDQIENTLSSGTWVVENTANVGKAALIVNQTKGGDLFAASLSGTTKFRITSAGDVFLGDNSGTDLTVGGGTGKIDVGTVDPPYTINGKKFATYLSGIIGVKEEVVGQVETSQYIEGLGYKSVIDFNNLPEGSDLWLFGKTTNIKENIEKLVALLTPSFPTRVWYDVDQENDKLIVYSAKPTKISFRLTAPRFDADNWSNTRNSDIAGFIINNPDTINNNERAPVLQTFANFIVEKVNGMYQLKDSANNIVAGLESFGNLIAANIKTGYLEAQEFVSPTIKTAMISPVSGSDLIVKLPDTSKLEIVNSDNLAVAEFDNQGNATFSGELSAKTIKSETIDHLESLIAEASNWNTNTATESMDLATLTTRSLYVTDIAAMTSLTVSQDLSVNNINSANQKLSIQSLALAPVEIMAGKFRIDTNGNVVLDGNLNVAGNISATGAGDFDKISANELIIGSVPEATASASVNGEIITNTTLGQAIIPALTSEITIRNPKITDYTLIYTTPTSPTQNKVLYIKSKGAGYFTVGFSDPLETETTFNWWIVNSK